MTASSARADAKILIADDHIEMAHVLAEQLTDAGYETRVAQSGEEALAIARAENPDLVITDLRMEVVDGLDVLARLKDQDPSIAVIVMTAFGAVDTAIEAIKRGAYHYLAKPLQLAEVLLYVQRALADRRMRDDYRALQKIAQERSGLGALVGRSPVMGALFERIERAAPANVPVLILGESGTGKELVARALHLEGPRRDRPFVAINCTALPETLLESELFGHAKGAFTGATGVRRGLFVEADGGTLFLDEIGDMAPSLQSKLLRVLESGEVRAVGADASRTVDVRVVAATHQNLEELVTQGKFRMDLFYRLNVVPMFVPNLESRVEDIPALIERFLARAIERNPNSPVAGFSPELVSKLCACSWPGNVRQLQNVVERLVILSTKEIVDETSLEVHEPQITAAPPPLLAAKERMISLRQLEDEYISWVLAQCGGNKTRAAEVLGIDASTIYRRERSSSSAR
jgi:two-component system, NtrC family, response regulator HydG